MSTGETHTIIPMMERRIPISVAPAIGLQLLRVTGPDSKVLEHLTLYLVQGRQLLALSDFVRYYESRSSVSRKVKDRVLTLYLQNGNARPADSKEPAYIDMREWLMIGLKSEPVQQPPRVIVVRPPALKKKPRASRSRPGVDERNANVKQVTE